MDTRERANTGLQKQVGLYLLIGGIAYLVIYFVAFHHGGAGGGY